MPTLNASVSRYRSLIFILLSLAICLLIHNWVFRVDAGDLGWRGADDACYYYVIAKNVAAGNGATFDGLSKTNGFHPLWLGVASAIFKIAPSDESALRAIFVFQWGLLVICGAGIGILTCRVVHPIWAIAATISFLTIPSVTRLMLSGMETGLAVACLFAAFYAFAKLTEATTQRTTQWFILLGVFTILASLSRLECALIAPLLGLVMLIQRSRSNANHTTNQYTFPRRKSVHAYVVASLVPFALYLLWSWSYFDALTPVSGMIKRANAKAQAMVFFENGDILGLLNRIFEIKSPLDGIRDVFPTTLGGDLGLSIIRGAIYVLLLAPLTIPAIRRRLTPAIAALFSLAVSYVLAEKILFFGRALPAYYLIPLFLTFPIATALLGQWVTDLCGNAIKRVTNFIEGSPVDSTPIARRISFAGLTLIAIPIIAFLAVMLRHGHYQQHGYLNNKDGYYHSVYSAAKWLNQNCGPSETAAAWNAGVIGFYSNRRIINLDGYVNSVAFARELTESRDVRTLVDRIDPDYLIDRISFGIEPLDLHPELKYDWIVHYRNNARNPNGLNGGFCVYRRLANEELAMTPVPATE